MRWTRRLEGVVTPGPAVSSDGKRAYLQDMGRDPLGVDHHAHPTRAALVGRPWRRVVCESGVGPRRNHPDCNGQRPISVRDVGRKPEILWRFATGDTIEVSPAVAGDGTTVIGSNDPFEYAVNPNGSLRWRYRKDLQTYGSPTVTADGRVLFGDHRGRVTTLSLSNGKEIAVVLGEQKPGRSRSVGVWTSPAIARQGNVYVGTRLGHIYGFTREGKRLFDIDTHDTVDSYPALTADGTLLVGSRNGLLYAIADRGGALPQSMFSRCSVDVQSMFSRCSVDVQSMYSRMFHRCRMTISR
jgi:PQQ-like domain